MKKLLILILALSLMTVSVYATETRTMTMGNNGNVLVDDANQFSFYGRTFNYPNIAVGEFEESDDFTSFGINWKFGTDKPWVLGTYFSTESAVNPDDYFGFATPAMFSWDHGLEPNRRITLLYGRELGNFNFGFGFDYVSSAWQSEVTDDQSEEAFSTMGFGLGLTDVKGKWDIAVDVSLGSLTDKAADGALDTDKDSWTDFGFRGRYFYEYNPNITFVPHAEGTFGTHAVIYPVVPADDNTEWKSTKTAFEFGVGMNVTPANNVLAVLDFGVQSQTLKNEFTDPNADPTVDVKKETKTTLPFWKIGMEADVFKWLDVRMGATSNWESIKDEGVDKTSRASNDTYLGFGFHFGRLHVDTYTDPEVFLNGFDFVSGDGDGDMNMSISALYEMF